MSLLCNWNSNVHIVLHLLPLFHVHIYTVEFICNWSSTNLSQRKYGTEQRYCSTKFEGTEVLRYSTCSTSVYRKMDRTYCTELYILFCTVLYCAALCCTVYVLYCIYWTFCTVLYYTVYTVLYIRHCTLHVVHSRLT